MSHAATDLEYMHARYFSAHLGRFQSVDPVGGAPSWPQSWSRYSYVLGNPMKYTDPRGLIPGVLQPFDQFAGAFLPSMNFITVTGSPFLFSPGSASIPFRGRRSSSSGVLGALVRAQGSDPLGEALERLPRIIGFGCDDLFNPAVGIGAAGGVLFGGAVDITATPRRGELTFTVGAGVGGGISAFPLGLGGGESEGLGLGYSAILGMPVGLNGILSGKLSGLLSPEELAGVFGGIGAGGGEGIAAGVTYTFELYDKCQ